MPPCANQRGLGQAAAKKTAKFSEILSRAVPVTCVESGKGQQLFLQAALADRGKIATFASPFGRDGKERVKRSTERKKFSSLLAKRKKLLTFASRFGRRRSVRGC
ncbi:hypothetical protein DXT99_24390 [Pontibacter diazotrophicus]|uniref:Uncharacterized protein n=1 Tax=Pontibacter diazotrophicus TaxID=1400979 RepID=A0A3D8L3I6_9BACT|nr:hypothetical protein DXT99_24390 [Pontibacter diazotrophicus]